MKNIIEELFYGNIDPQARGFKKDSYLQNTIHTETALIFILLLVICSALTVGKPKRI